ncbi:MAG: class I SAM-dependent methyltransferase [Patescibacteria group bacterium]|nr:class I SAM-dependent methyltransferase [Patescibacteria group bacterium]
MLVYILYAILFVVIGTAAYAGISAAPWVPTKPKQTQRMIECLDLFDGAKVYDLGCGSGTLLFAAAKKNPNILAVGFEISVLPFLVAKIRSLFSRQVTIHYGNLFKKDLRDADVVTVFLMSKIYNKLAQKFSKELKNDALVILEVWPFPNLEPERTIREENLLPMFVYRGRQFRISGTNTL